VNQLPYLLPRVRVPLLICPITSIAWDDQTQRLVTLLGAL
jgi:hypothetical protein